MTGISRTDHARFLRVKHFGSLDGLRCVSILLVVFSHTVGAKIPALRTGIAGVFLFFAISGFLITTLLLREKSLTGDIDLVKFYKRRSLRIFPLYYTVLALYVVLVFFTERHNGAGTLFAQLPYYLTYTSNLLWPPINEQIGIHFTISWTLATEEQFYFVWPSIEKWLKERQAVVVMLCVSCVAIVQKLGWMDGILTIGSISYRLINSIATPICLGVLVAHLLNSPGGYRVAGKFWSSYNSLIGFVLMGILTAMRYSISPVALAVVCAFIVLSCVQNEKHALSGFLQQRHVASYGAVSYGIYLLHPLTAHVVMIAMRRLRLIDPHVLSMGLYLHFLLTAVAAYGVAWLSYRYYESYFLRLKQRFAVVPTRHPSNNAGQGYSQEAPRFNLRAHSMIEEAND